MKKINPEERISENNAAFIAYYCKEMRPWINSTELSDEQRKTTVPAILFLNRWDGKVGFPGGKVDGDETFKEAAIRESIEEIGLKVDENEITHVCSHNFPTGKSTLSTHLYSKEVTSDELFEIQKNIIYGEHYGPEIMGSIICLVGDFGRGKGFPTFIKSPMSSSVKEEIMELLLYKDLLTQTELSEMLPKTEEV